MRPRLGTWPLLVVWVLLPLAAGATVARALETTSAGFQTAMTVGAWACWATVLVAGLVPLPATLTLLRVSVPAAPFLLIWATWAAEPEARDAVGLGMATLALMAALSPGLADACVDGSSYGTERRFALRTPARLVLGPVPATWLMAAGGLLTGPVLVAARLWAPGAVAWVLGWLGAWWAVRALHGLARRWIVLVPAGLVVHDHLTLADPVLLARGRLERLGPAPASSHAEDLTGGAWGLALEASLEPPVELVRAGTEARDLVTAGAVLFTPLRPGALLAGARDHRLPVA